MKHESYPPLLWVERNGILRADTGGHGRYSIRQRNGRWSVRLNGDLLDVFDSLESAKQRAEYGARILRDVAAEEDAFFNGGWKLP
jgi:hypothetical protein